MHLGCCSTFRKCKNTLVCGSSIFTLSESLATSLVHRSRNPARETIRYSFIIEHFPEKNISKKGRDDKYGKSNLNYVRLNKALMFEEKNLLRKMHYANKIYPYIMAFLRVVQETF